MGRERGRGVALRVLRAVWDTDLQTTRFQLGFGFSLMKPTLKGLFMPNLTLDNIVTRGSEHVETEVGGQVLMMSLEQGKYFALDQTARRIWQLVAEPVPLWQVVETLLGEYEVEAERCEAEVLGFAGRLLSNGLIVLVPASE